MIGKSILVTGGAGFVGSYLCRALLHDGHTVTVVDDFSNGRKENVASGIRLFDLDITSREFFKKLAPFSYDTVIHCAAQASNALSFLDPHRDFEVNQLGTLRVLEFCVEKDIKRFIFTSSMSVYGQAKHIPTKETEVCLPDAYYAVHKLASEHYIRIYGQEHGLDCTIFRLYTTYGHGQNLDNINQGLLSIFLSYIVNNKPIIVKGSKDRTRDIIHVNDVVEAIILSISNDISINKVYNMGSGQYLSIEEIIELLTTGMGYKSDEYPVIYEESTKGDPFNTLADNSLARQELGWQPKISPTDGIKLTIEAYRSQKNEDKKK